MDCFNAWWGCDPWSQDRQRRKGTLRFGRCDSRQMYLVACHDLVDRFRLDHPAWEMCMLSDISPSVHARSHLDRVLVKRADTDFLACTSFDYIEPTDRRIVRLSLQLRNSLSLPIYWKLSTSLLKIRDFRNRQESQIQRTLVGAVTRNRWWGSLKHSIGDFVIRHGSQLNLDRNKVAKCLEDKVSQ